MSVPSQDQLRAAFEAGRKRRAAAAPVVAAPAIDGAPSAAELIAAAEAARVRRAARRKGRVPRGNGPAQAARAYVSLPPPHIVVPRTYDATEYRDQALKNATLRGYRDVGGLPWWAWHVAARCHRRNWREEVRRLPRQFSLQVQRAAELGRTDAAKRSIAAIGCVITWIAIRHPKRVGIRTNVGGISGASLQLLTQNGKKQPYSLSTIQHASHSGAGKGVVSDGDAGFIEHLRFCGAVRHWIPPAQLVPDWMRGAVHAFAIFAVPGPLELLESS